MSNYLPYAGIGSRETPDDVLDVMFRIGRTLARNGFTLRSGGADGADTAFEQGAVSTQHSGATAGTEIFLPWKGFNKRNFGIVPFENMLEAEAYNIAAKFHPAWDKCSVSVQKMHMRNVAQVLGADLKSPSKFIVCWTINGQGGGGTGQALRIAKAWGVPIFDLGLPDRTDTLDKLSAYCEYLIHPEIADFQ